MNTGPVEASDALREWTKRITEKRLRPLLGQTHALADSATITARSLERRCKDIISRTEREMVGLGDHKRSRAGTVMIRMCREIAEACRDFPKSQMSNVSVAELESDLARLVRNVMASYNSSGRVAANFSRSQAGQIAAEVDSLHRLYKQVSSFQSKNNGVMEAGGQIDEQVSLLGKALDDLGLQRESQAKLELQIEQAMSRLRSITEEISGIGEDPRVKSLDDLESNLRRLRERMLRDEMSRLRGVIARFTAFLEREGGSRETLRVLSGYLDHPLTSLAREREGHPLLRTALEELLMAVQRRSIGLNERKARKVRERVARILRGSLLSVQSAAREAFQARAIALRSESVKQLRSQRLRLKAEYSRLLAEKARMENGRNRAEEETVALKEQVSTRLELIEKLSTNWFESKMSEELKQNVLRASVRSMVLGILAWGVSLWEWSV